ncbi:MAG: MBL fold metallo-hydrolase [Caldilineaceae bacterium]
MKLTDNVHIVGGGRMGFGISGALDCHVYLIDGGSELALVDPGLGLGRDFDLILENIRNDGVDPQRIRKLILTHYHADHVGAAHEAQRRLDLEVIASPLTGRVLVERDEVAIALDVAKAAGFYPQDFYLQACPVHQQVVEGDTVQVGELTLQVWETPGHCDGHLSFRFQGSDRIYLLGGDLVFHFGRVVLQNIHDCRIDAYNRSVQKIAGLDFDALLPGHVQISLRHGKDHVEMAAKAFRQLGVPPNLI